MNFDDTLKKGLIEFLDVEEEETAMIAMHVSDLKFANKTGGGSSGSSKTYY